MSNREKDAMYLNPHFVFLLHQNDSVQVHCKCLLCNRTANLGLDQHLAIKYVQEKKERKKITIQWFFPILSVVLHYYFSSSRLAERKEWVTQGTHQQMIRKVSANVWEMPCIPLCIYLSGKLSIIFLLPSK